MGMKLKLFIAFLWFFIFSAKCQKIEIIESGFKTSIRGLSVVNDQVVWISGSNGMVGYSLNGGVSWKYIIVPGYEKREFRDIEAFNQTTALVMAIDCPAVILKTIDGGVSWKEVLKDTTRGMFLDAMDFHQDKYGVVIGDPINGFFYKASTSDTGNHWQVEKSLIHSEIGEACFASSGSNIKKINKRNDFFVTGGQCSYWRSKHKKKLIPILQGLESAGANSVACKNNSYCIVVGGDYTQRNDTIQHIAITSNQGNTWFRSTQSPTGYRSCIEFISNHSWITCGLNGVDFSADDGLHFKKISEIGFHVCKKSKSGKAVFLAGNGKIGKLMY